MSGWPLWGVLTPGEPAQLEDRARSIVMTEMDQELGKKQPFEVIPGRGRYHAIVGADLSEMGAEMQLAEELSLEVDEPVYSIDRANDPWTVLSWRNGAMDVLEVDPDALASSLGCPLPGKTVPSDSPERKPLRSAALIEGLRAQEAQRALEEEYGEPLSPGRLRLEDTPQGLRISSTTGSIGFAHITLSERFPHATGYSVIASPSLDWFFVTKIRGGEGIEEFVQPPNIFPNYPVASTIKGEISPERILAALGIPAEWFRNE
ncbi:hypothetical protein KYC5002_15845 [Archangium violaceum]|uniref:hypothetical protein n=1 Tax=Archangium violaceum TaxID=83451 RepID=UPI002B2FED2F|nr:hypothetical protein KYC5002_15845 [Archangium gephyra]